MLHTNIKKNKRSSLKINPDENNKTAIEFNDSFCSMYYSSDSKDEF